MVQGGAEAASAGDAPGGEHGGFVGGGGSFDTFGGS